MMSLRLNMTEEIDIGIMSWNVLCYTSTFIILQLSGSVRPSVGHINISFSTALYVMLKTNYLLKYDLGYYVDAWLGVEISLKSFRLFTSC